jgi:hypothetical protein
MSKRLFVVAFCILFLPMLASTSHSKNANVSGPAMVAFAGHTSPGGEACFPCGCSSTCRCDSGEQPGLCINRATPPSDDKLPGRGTPSSNADYGTGALILALALMFWLRLRA